MLFNDTWKVFRQIQKISFWLLRQRGRITYLFLATFGTIDIPWLWLIRPDPRLSARPRVILLRQTASMLEFFAT
jgi:hypothetical protein